MIHPRFTPACLFAVLLAALPAQAETLRVGPGQAYAQPSEALRAATDDDTIEIAEGEYYNCSQIRNDRITIVGLGRGATFTDTTCDGKAQLVVQGNDITIRNITFTRARVNDGNGAGIRAEGRNLTVERARFVNNQVAILAAQSQHSIITIRNTTFDANGNCTGEGRCLATLMVPGIARLRVEDSTFTNARGGVLLQSAARRTEIIHSSFTDGPTGKAAGFVIANVGALVMDDNRMEKNSPFGDRRAAILLLPSEAPLGEIVIRRNSFLNSSGQSAALVMNWSGGDPLLERNRLPDGDSELTTDGVLRFRAGTAYRNAKSAALDAARAAKQGLKLLNPF